MAGSIFINSCIFNHAPVVHTSKSQLGSMSRKDNLILLSYCSKLRSTNPPDFIFSSCSLSFDGTIWYLASCQVLCLLKPSAIYPCQLLQLSLRVTDQFIMKAKKQLDLFQSGLQGKLLSYLANMSNRILHLHVIDYCNWVESTDGWVEFLLQFWSGWDGAGSCKSRL